MNDDLRVPFEREARLLLARHPHIPHVWNSVGERLDLVIRPRHSTGFEVWASAYDYQIAVGSGPCHRDFEDFGRKLSADDVVREALEYLVGLLHPSVRLRVWRAGGQAYEWLLERLQGSEWVEIGRDSKIIVRWGERTEHTFTNDWLPPAAIAGA